MGLLDLIKRDKDSKQNQNTNRPPQSRPMQQGQSLIPGQPSVIPAQMNMNAPQGGVPMQPQPVPQQIARPPQAYDRNLAQAPIDTTPIQNDYGYSDLPGMQNPMAQGVPNTQAPMAQTPDSNIPNLNSMPSSNPAPIFEQMQAPISTATPEQVSQKLEQNIANPISPTEQSPMVPNAQPSMDELEKQLTQNPLPDFSNFSVPNQSQPVEAPQSPQPEVSMDTSFQQQTAELPSINEPATAPIEPQVLPQIETVIPEAAPENQMINPLEEQPIEPQPIQPVESVLDIPAASEPSVVPDAEPETKPTEVIIGTNEPSANSDQPSEINNLQSSTLNGVSPTDEELQNIQNDVQQVNTQPSTEVPKFDLPNLDLSQLQLPPVQTQLENTTVPESDTAKLEVPPIDTNVQQKIEENQKPKTNNQKSRKKFMFKKIALLGLNGPKIDATIADSVKKLVKDLIAKDAEVIVDSKNGLGDAVIQEVANAKSTYTGVYLLPFMSDDSDQANEKLVGTEGAAVLYSNYIERLKHVAKEPRLHIFFGGAGLTNWATLMSIWNIAAMYPSKHKPIILVGKEWKSFIDQLSQSMSIDQSDLAALTFVNTPEEVMPAIEKLNDAYKQDKVTKPIRVIDRRVEGDEMDYILY